MHEHENIQFDDVAKILQQAHLRRSIDLGLWLKQFLRESRLKAHKATSHALDKIASVNASGARRRVRGNIKERSPAALVR